MDYFYYLFPNVIFFPVYCMLGGTCAVWFGGGENIDGNLEAQLEEEVGRRLSLSSKKRNPFSVDLFGSLCCTLQHGKFKNDFNDLTRIDARLDISSASAFMKGACHLLSDICRGRVDREVNPFASPKLNVILQQQVYLFMHSSCIFHLQIYGLFSMCLDLLA